MPVATGISLAHKLRGETDRISIGAFGDGAANQGQLFEAINMAKIWKLPTLFMLENNHQAMGTATERHSMSGDSFQDRYTHLKGIWVDCTDTFLLREVFRQVKAYMCKEQEPMYMECSTYR